MANDNPKQWMVIEADGRAIGLVLQGSAQHKRATADLAGLAGIHIYSARQEHLKRFERTILEHEAKKRAAEEKRAMSRK